MHYENHRQTNIIHTRVCVCVAYRYSRHISEAALTSSSISFSISLSFCGLQFFRQRDRSAQCTQSTASYERVCVLVCVSVCLSGPVACCNNSWKIITRATTIAAAMRRLIQNSEIVFKVFARLLLLFFKYNLFLSDFCLLFLHISFIVFYVHFVVTLRIRRFNAACSWCCLRAVFCTENWILLFT